MVDGLFGKAERRKHWIARLVGFFVTAVMFDQHSELQEPLLRWRVTLPKEKADLLDAFKNLVWKEVIQSPRVQQLELKGQSMVISVTQAFQLEGS